MALTDSDGRVRHADPDFLLLLGIEPQTPLAGSLLEALAPVPVRSRLQRLREQAACTSGAVTVSIEPVCLRAQQVGSRLHWLAYRAPSVLSPRPQRDGLTGLLGRDALLEHMHAWVAAQRPFSVAFIDLDRFKAINDTLGHAAGDRALAEIADRLRLALNGRGEPYRLGGDEFVVLLPEVRQARLEQLLRRALEQISAWPVRCGGCEFYLGASAGLALFPLHGAEPTTLLRRADMAMYEGKRSRRGGLHWYCDSLEQAAVEQVAIEAALRRALERGELALHYQPKAALPSLKCIGAEALLYWRRPGHGDWSPGQFLPVAEKSNLMRRIDQWVLRQALSELAQLRHGGAALPLAINLSDASLSDVSLPAEVETLLAQFQVPPWLVEFEVSEAAVMADCDSSSSVLAGLHRLGVTLSVDDFGIGYSSLSRLWAMPLHALKIDRQFVVDLSAAGTAHGQGAAIVQAVAALGRSLQLQVVAEGVERLDQVTWLHELGCDAIQGYLYSRPLPLPQLSAFFASYQHGGAGLWAESLPAPD